MREIKFRAWDEELKKMKDWEYYGDIPSTAKAFFQLEYPLMQYTGLKDKNGGEIYEGDILKCKYYHVFKRAWSNLEEIEEIDKEVEEQRNQITEKIFKIEFEDGGFVGVYPIVGKDISRGERFKKGRVQYSTSDYEEKYWDFEVIGNIYENPELLKEQ